MSGAVVCEQGECSKLLYAVSCVGLSLLSSLQFMEGGDLRAALVSDAELAWYGKATWSRSASRAGWSSWTPTDMWGCPFPPMPC